MIDKHRHVFIHGRVQGVGYRAWTASEARRRGLGGFVRNRRDGSVEALLIGPPAAIAELIAAMRQGPPAARVESVQETPTGEVILDLASPDFAMLPTA